MSYYDFSLSRETCLEEEQGSTEDHAFARLGRVFRMLSLLQSGGAYTSNALSDKFCVAKRTIFRDIKMLREIGIQIDSGPRGQGYYLNGAIFSKPVPPTSAEIAVMVLGVHLARNMETSGLERLLDGAIERLLGTSDSSTAERLAQFDQLFDIVDVASIAALPDAKWLPNLLECLQSRTLVQIWIPSQYLNGHDDCVNVIPRQLKLANQSWRLMCWNEDGRDREPIDLSSVRALGHLDAATMR